MSFLGIFHEFSDVFKLNWIPGIEFLSLEDAKNQFRINMLDQLNLAREAQNLVVFRKNFRKSTDVSRCSPPILTDHVTLTGRIPKTVRKVEFSLSFSGEL